MHSYIHTFIFRKRDVLYQTCRLLVQMAQSLMPSPFTRIFHDPRGKGFLNPGNSPSACIPGPSTMNIYRIWYGFEGF